MYTCTVIEVIFNIHGILCTGDRLGIIIGKRAIAVTGLIFIGRWWSLNTSDARSQGGVQGSVHLCTLATTIQ